MNINPQYENEVRRLLKLNKRAEAARYLQNKLNVSNTDADRLVQAVENEIQFETMQATQAVKSSAGGCGKVLLKVLSFGFGFFGIGFILVGIGASVLFNYVESGSVEVQGRVVSLRASENEGGGYAPVIEYDWNGVTKTHYSEVYSSPPDFQTGQVIPVWVNPDNPDNATVIYENTARIVMWIFGGIGAFFLIIAFGLFWFSRKINSTL
jgi:hypothetical protein